MLSLGKDWPISETVRERLTAFWLLKYSSKQRLCRVSGVSLIVIGMAGSSGVLHTGSQIFPKDLLQLASPVNIYFCGISMH